jgi:hypothetical protein
MALPDDDRQQVQGYRFTNGKLKADFEIIRTLAHNRGAVWTDKAGTSRSKVVGTTLDASSFSDIPSCKEFGSVYAAAKRIYEETLKGIEQDVKDYQAKLLQVAKHLEDKDNQAGEVFAALAAPDATPALHSTDRHAKANETQEARDAERLQEEATKEANRAGADTTPTDGGDGGADTPSPTDTTGDNLVNPGGPPPASEGDQSFQASR